MTQAVDCSTFQNRSLSISPHGIDCGVLCTSSTTSIGSVEFQQKTIAGQLAEFDSLSAPMTKSTPVSTAASIAIEPEPTLASTATVPGSSDALDGRWQLVSTLADGPITRLFHARPANASPDRPTSYVVKLLHSQWWDDRETIRRFDRECRIGRTISNRHLVSVLEGQTDRPPYYLIMPHLEGVTLEWLMRQTTRPDLPAVLWFTRQIADALNALDQAQCVHGDVKPGNILISSTGHATLLDLGFARHRDDRHASSRQCVTGTVRYMAPELLDTNPETEPGIASDMYSLGVILYEALTGHLPYDAVDLHHLATLHRDQRPCRVGELVPGLPEVVAELVHRLISLDPADRPSSPRSLIRRLTQLEIETFAIRQA